MFSSFTFTTLPLRKKWFATYTYDHNTNFFMEYLHHNASKNSLCIIKLDDTYRKTIAQNLLCINNYRLFYLDPITVSTNHICCIIVSLSLRRIIFNSMHTSPTTCYIRKYKTLYRLKLRFFWPRMRSDIQDWVRHCLNCILIYKLRRRGQEVMFSWPIRSPFVILHADLLMPIHFTHSDGDVDFMNIM